MDEISYTIMTIVAVVLILLFGVVSMSPYEFSTATHVCKINCD